MFILKVANINLYCSLQQCYNDIDLVYIPNINWAIGVAYQQARFATVTGL